jgi:hypothetical protein
MLSDSFVEALLGPSSSSSSSRTPTPAASRAAPSSSSSPRPPTSAASRAAPAASRAASRAAPAASRHTTSREEPVEDDYGGRGRWTQTTTDMTGTIDASADDLEERIQQTHAFFDRLQRMNVTVYVYTHPSLSRHLRSFARDVEHILTQLPPTLRQYTDIEPFPCRALSDYVRTLRVEIVTRSFASAAEEMDQPLAPAPATERDHTALSIGLFPSAWIRRFDSRKEHTNVTFMRQRACAINYECYEGRVEGVHNPWGDQGMYCAYAVNHEVLHALGFAHMAKNWQRWMDLLLDHTHRLTSSGRSSKPYARVTPCIYQHSFGEFPDRTPLPFPSFYDGFLQASLSSSSVGNS